MNKRFPHVARGQTALEYLLLLGLVAFVTFAAFTSNGFMSKVKDSSTDYFTKIGRVIQGENPTTPITGKWCEWSLCTNYIQFRTCECPAPAFGGSCEAGSNWQHCGGGSLPTCGSGQRCNIAGSPCSCPGGTTCDLSTGYCRLLPTLCGISQDCTSTAVPCYCATGQTCNTAIKECVMSGYGYGP